MQLRYNLRLHLAMRGISALRGLSALSGNALSSYLETATRGLSSASDLKSALKDKIPEQQVTLALMPARACVKCMLVRDEPVPAATSTSNTSSVPCCISY